MADGVRFIRVRGRVVPIRASERAKVGYQVGAGVGSSVGAFVGSMRKVPANASRFSVLTTVLAGMAKGAATGAAGGAVAGSALMAVTGPREVETYPSFIKNGEYKAKLTEPFGTALSVAGMALIAKRAAPSAASKIAGITAIVSKKYRRRHLRVIK